jgi:signal transduction histidine kinase
MAPERRRALRSIRAWLSRVPVADPVDRSNAVVLQLILLGIVLTAPPPWIYRLAFSDLPLRAGEGTSIALSATVVVFALLGQWLVRRGHFQPALRGFLVVIALVLMLSYAAQGAAANAYEAPLQLAWLVMAGLMAGRRALWLLYAWIAAAILIGTAVDVPLGSDAPADLYGMAMVNLLINLFVAILVDRTTTAFRHALAAAHARERDLVLAGNRLREEIEHRQRVHRQLVHSQKVEVAGRLAAGLAHDLNHLLSLILGYRARAAGSNDPAQRAEALAGIDAAARRAAAVSRRLLSFSRGDDPRPCVFDLNEALQAMRPMLRQLFDASVQLQLAPSDTALPIRMDRSQFELVILNLAANAATAMPGGGTVRISVEARQGERAVATLRDSGIGMDEATLGQAMEPFFTTRAEGTGLGLTVARDVLAAVGAVFTIESRSGHGTTVSVAWPLLEPAQALANATPVD